MSHTYISWELNEWACLLRHNFVQILIKDTLGIIKWNTYKPPSQEEKSPDPISHFFPFCVLFLHLSLGGNIKQMLFLSPLCTQAAIWPVSLASMEWTATKPALAMSRTAIPCLVLAIYVRKISRFFRSMLWCWRKTCVFLNNARSQRRKKHSCFLLVLHKQKELGPSELFVQWARCHWFAACVLNVLIAGCTHRAPTNTSIQVSVCSGRVNVARPW